MCTPPSGVHSYNNVPEQIQTANGYIKWDSDFDRGLAIEIIKNAIKIHNKNQIGYPTHELSLTIHTGRSEVLQRYIGDVQYVHMQNQDNIHQHVQHSLPQSIPHSEEFKHEPNSSAP